VDVVALSGSLTRLPSSRMELSEFIRTSFAARHPRARAVRAPSARAIEGAAPPG
jgi:hypothetical protein